MRLQAVLFLLVTLGFCSASSRRTPPTTTTPSDSQIAKILFSQYKKLQTNPGPSQSNLGSNQDPNVCYTKNQEEGRCVKSSMCELDPQTINADEIFTYRSAPKSAYDCDFLMTCCTDDKIRTHPVPPTISTPLGCGYSNAAAGRFRQVTGTSKSGYADFAEFPWMVALLKNSRYNPASGWNDKEYLGGGTLIHPSVVLTVAHKVDTMAASDYKCRAGEWDTENENESYEHQDREVQKIILHEQFDRRNAYYDVALLIMETPFELKPHINVACLSQTVPPPGTLCYSMGWGMDFTKGEYNANVLKKIPMPLTSKNECERKYRRTKLGQRFVVHPSLMCAGGVSRYADTCIGDGGSSLVCPVGDPADLRYNVVGMVVYGMECGSQYPNAFAKVPEFYNWVQQRLNKEGFYEMPYSI